MKRIFLPLFILALSAVLFACSTDSDSEPDGDSEAEAADGDEPDGDETDGDAIADGDEEDSDGDRDEVVDGDLDVETAENEDEGEEAETEPAKDPIDLVDPFIGTGGLGFTVGSGFPGPKTPFGMIAVSPDTGTEKGDGMPFYHCGGYHADDGYIIGFSHTHLYGVGANEYGNILFMPTLGPIDEQAISSKNYRSAFDKENEHAEPGYYSVLLNDTGIQAELATSVRSAHHRYTYPADLPDGKQYLLIDLERTIPGGEITDGGIELLPEDNSLEGWVLNENGFTGRYDGIDIYFAARFNQAYTAAGT